MTILRVPKPLRPYTGGKSEVELQGTTVEEAMSHFIELYPALQPHLYNGSGELRTFVNLFVNDENIKDLQGLQTTLKETDRLMLIPSIAGGSHHAS